jgi:hypothetical protein
MASFWPMMEESDRNSLYVVPSSAKLKKLQNKLRKKGELNAKSKDAKKFSLRIAESIATCVQKQRVVQIPKHVRGRKKSAV